jgi:hypothetical protein
VDVVSARLSVTGGGERLGGTGGPVSFAISDDHTTDGLVWIATSSVRVAGGFVELTVSGIDVLSNPSSSLPAVSLTGSSSSVSEMVLSSLLLLCVVALVDLEELVWLTVLSDSESDASELVMLLWGTVLSAW